MLLMAVCLSAGLIWLKWYKATKVVLTITAFGVLLVTVVPVGSLVLNNLENRFPQVKTLPKDIAGIIVLGGVVNQFITVDRKQIAVGGAVERLTEFAKLAARYPTAKLIFTGGSGQLGKQGLKEADVIAPLLRALGLNPGRVLFESQSRNTSENATFSKKMMKPNPRQNWILITSAFHMPRAIGSFRRAGWNVFAYPVDYYTTTIQSLSPKLNLRKALNRLSISIHEWVGLTFYWLSGRTNRLYPQP